MKYLSTALLMIISIWGYSQTEVRVNVTTSENENATGKVQISSDKVFAEAELVNGTATFVLEENLTNEISVSSYPNPVFNGSVSISISGVDKVGILSFYTLLGKKIGEIELDKSANIVLNNARGGLLYQYRNTFGQQASGKIISFSENLAVSVETIPAQTILAEKYTATFIGEESQSVSQSIYIASGQTETIDMISPFLKVGSLTCSDAYDNACGTANNGDFRLDAAHSLGGNTNVSWMGGASASDMHAFIYFTEKSLSSEGDKITLTVDYYSGNGVGGLTTSNNTANAFRIGLMDNGGTTVATNSGISNAGFSGYAGYYGGYAVKSNNAPGIFKRDTGQNSLILGSAGTSLGTGTQTGDMVGGELRTITLVIEKTSGGNDITITHAPSGTFSFTQSDNSGAVADFNTIVLGYDDTPELMDWLYIDNITVEHCTAPTYALTVNSGTGDGDYGEDSAVPIVAGTFTGWTFDYWGIVSGGGSLADANSASTTYNMPGNAAEITAYFMFVPTTYSLTVNSGTGDGDYEEDEVVNISADAAPSGQQFDVWTGDTSYIANVNSASTTVTMPASAIAVTATYENIDQTCSDAYDNACGTANNGDFRFDAAHNLGGSADVSWMGSASASDMHAFIYFNEKSLLSVGDKITLTVDYYSGNGVGGLTTSNNTANAFRIGLMDNGGNTVANNSGISNAGFSNYTGYYGGYAVKSANAPGIFKRDTGQSSLILGSAGTSLGTGTQTGDMVADQLRTITLEIEKTSSGNDITISHTPSGTFSFTQSDNSGDVTDFNTIVLGYDDTPELMDWLYIDNITVEHCAIPLPANTLTVNSGSGDGDYSLGTDVTIDAGYFAGWTFNYWQIDSGGGTIADVNSSTTTYSMPDNAAEITAKFRQISISDTITLPIEVMGAPGHIETVTLDIGSNASVAEDLWVQVHNISYDKKGRVRVNGGSWIDLSNTNAQINIQEPDKSYGGFGGGFSVVRFKVNKSDVSFVDGQNVIEFEYNHRDGPTAGYRVIKLNILDGSGNKLIAESNFEMDDPTTWTAPLNNSTDIAAGETLWYTVDLSGTEASCTHCHTNSGMDLKYFNVSNKTIVQQAMKSGLTQTQGEQIASYIRTIDQTVVPAARVWNPAYQPGPGTDAKPVYEWAAGAGIDAVLDSDEEMLPYIFGDGTRTAIDQATGTRSTMNLREMPIAVQFPDWLKWIPRTHPIDIWGKNFWETSNGYFDNPNVDNAHKALETLHDDLQSPANANQLAINGQLIATVEKFAHNVMWWLGYNEANNLHPWCALNAPTLNARNTTYSRETAKHNLATWQSIKIWETMMIYELQDKAIVEKPTVGPDNLTAAEKYNWPCNRLLMFVIPAHFTGDYRGDSHFQWESQLVGTYFSSIWYQVQMTVNPGMRSGYNVAPVDWAYNLYHVNLIGERSGVYEPLRMSQNIVKCYQQRDKEINGVIEIPSWNMREVSPWRLYSDWKGHQGTMSKLDEYQSGLRGRVTSSLLAEFVRKSNEFDLSKWPRTNTIVIGNENWEKLEYANYDPTGQNTPGTTNLFSIDGSKDAVEAIAIYKLLDGNYNNGENRLEEIGVDPVVIDSLADWADIIWTNTNTNWYNWK
jgi:hypothetical protein